MKILAIRGENIASLPRFELDLTRGPLADAGVFAIVGDTGSGKSTILDAMCVALFDDTPRLKQRGRGRLKVMADGADAEHALSTADPRNLIRRGSDHAWAEVEFTGVDGRTYRSRWIAHRAKRSGRFQNQKIVFTDVAADTSLGGKKGETLAAIQQKLGLDFDQFRRSALLAQGDFAAFLSASEDERGQLLERMTDSAIYAKISRQAFLKRIAAGKSLADLRTRAGAHVPLEPEPLQALQALRDQQHTAEADARAHEFTARAAVQWHTDAQRLTAELAAAKVEQDAAQRSRLAAEPLREELALLRRAAPVVPLLIAATEAAQSVTLRVAALTQAQEAVDRALSAQNKAATHAATCGTAHAEALDAELALKGPLKRARALDHDIAEQRRAHDVAKAALATATQLLARRQADEDAVSEEVSATTISLDSLRSARQVDAGHATLYQQSDRWAHALDTRASQLQALTSLRTELADADTEVERLSANLDRHSLTVAAARDAATQATTREARAAAAARKAPLADALAMRDAAQAKLQQLQQMDERLRRLLALESDADKTRDAAARADAQAQSVGDQLAALSDRILTTRVRADECSLALQQARSAQDLDARRGELVPGEPCTMCGSTTHPWASGSPISGLVAERAEREHTLLANLAELQDQRTRAAATRAGHVATAQQSRARVTQMDEEASRQRAGLDTYVNDTGALECPLPASTTQAIATLQPSIVQANADAAEAKRGLTQASEAADAHRTAQKALDIATRALSQARDLHDASKSALEPARNIVHALSDRVSQQAAALTQSKAQLKSALSSHAQWSRDADSDDGAACTRVAQALREAANSAAERTEQATKLEKRLTGLTRDLVAAKQRTEEARNDAKVCSANLTARTEQLTRATRERDEVPLVGAAPADDVEAAAARATRARADELARATTAQAEADREHAAAVAGAHAAKRNETDARTRNGQCQAQLASALQTAAITREQAEDARGQGPERAGVLEAQLGTIDTALAHASTLVDERTRTQAQHHATSPGIADADAARAALITSGDALSAARTALAQSQAALERDAQMRRTHAVIGREIAEQDAVLTHWKVLDDLIGSADGKKFRIFAQSLTLEALLVRANHQLEALEPRYRLVRVPGHHLELQIVDRHMGDEVRPLSSLSGGETFLASLALALALSALSAGDTPVESLFIDEGFGTLDRNTLGKALDLLESLQGEGRQIGIISHVPGIDEKAGAVVRVVGNGTGTSVLQQPTG